MQVKAIAKNVQAMPRKVRMVANEVKGMPAQKAADHLRFHPSKSAFVLRKVLLSAMANAEENNRMNRDNLRVSEIQVGEAPRIKRIEQRAMGRANRIVKRLSHISVAVEEFEPNTSTSSNATKPKPRPSFATSGKKGKKKAASKEAEEAKAKEETQAEAKSTEAEEAKTEETEEETKQETAEESKSEETKAEEKAEEDKKDESDSDDKKE
jgi:large subunit ribosomal protein L22